LILTKAIVYKSELIIKLFMFEYIYVKLNLLVNFKLK